MNERKEQDELETLPPHGTGSLALSDERYTRLGKALQGASANVHSTSEGEVVGFPRRHGSRDTLTLAWSLFGRIPKSIMLVLGLERILAPIVIRNAVPSCPNCSVVAQRSATLSSYEVPEEGFVALAIRDGTQDVSLEERCELLGVERAYIDGRIVRMDDISGRDGEPVLRLFPASRLSEQRESIDEWFARGGGTLVVVYLAERESLGREVGTLSGGWRCPRCDQKVTAPSLADLYDPVACPRCKGEGWLHVEHGRLLACEDCDGFGSTAAVSNAQFGPVTLGHGAALTGEELLSGDFELTPEESRVLHELSAAGLGHYPIGSPLALLSSAEKILLATVSARLSKVRGLTCAIDVPALGLMVGAVEREVWSHSSDPALVLFEPAQHASSRRLREGSGRDWVELRDVCIGAVSAERISFPTGAASLVQTGAGAAALHLFDEIERRFLQRRKYSEVCNFGSIKRCRRVDCRETGFDSVIAMLGLERALAEGLARSQLARQSGYSVDDLDLSKGRFRCRGCADGETDSTRGPCSVCRGALYDWQVSSMPIGKSSLGQVMQNNLDEAQKLLWSYDVIDSVLARVPVELKGRLSFATNPAVLAPAEQRFLIGCAALAHVLSYEERGSKKTALRRASTLVLIEGAFATTAQYQEILLNLIEEALTAGATVICSGAPQALESCFSSVIRLVDCEVEPAERVQNRFLDRRLSRWSTAI
jgi:hypothetical protein